jgi:hypothetical protein
VQLHVVYVMTHVGVCGGVKVIFQHANTACNGWGWTRLFGLLSDRCTVIQDAACYPECLCDVAKRAAELLAP